MSDSVNPYAPPEAPLFEGPGAGGIWKDGNVLVVQIGGLLPCRCVKCNEPAEEPAKMRTVYWHHPLIYILVLLNVLIYALVALIARKKAVINPGLCAFHRKRRTMGIALGWIGSLLGVILAIGGAANESCGIGFLGFALFLASLIAGFVFARIVYPIKIDAEHIRLKGCGAAFLDSLPGYN